jgi:hypothetical protein
MNERMNERMKFILLHTKKVPKFRDLFCRINQLQIQLSSNDWNG